MKDKDLEKKIKSFEDYKYLEIEGKKNQQVKRWGDTLKTLINSVLKKYVNEKLIDS